MTYPPPVNPCVVSDVEIVSYTLRCPRGHTWTADPYDVNRDWNGDGCFCPTCGEYYKDLVDTKMEMVE